LKSSILFAEPLEGAYINGILKAIGSHNFVVQRGCLPPERTTLRLVPRPLRQTGVIS
jgi:hypothetical protein